MKSVQLVDATPLVELLLQVVMEVTKWGINRNQ